MLIDAVGALLDAEPIRMKRIDALGRRSDALHADEPAALKALSLLELKSRRLHCEAASHSSISLTQYS